MTQKQSQKKEKKNTIRITVQTLHWTTQVLTGSAKKVTHRVYLKIHVCNHTMDNEVNIFIRNLHKVLCTSF